MTTKTHWNLPAVPRHVIQMFVIDQECNLLLMHRSSTVRSAPNVWSYPSGMHEIGDTAMDTITRELKEELSLTPMTALMLDQYENIAGDPLYVENSLAELRPQFHWVISIYIVIVEDCTKFINNEPDKHDRIKIAAIEDISSTEFLEWHRAHDSLHSTLLLKGEHYRDVMYALLYESGLIDSLPE